MKTSNFLKKTALFSSCVALGFLASCSKDDKETFTKGDSADVVSESITESYFADMDDMTIAAIDDESSPAGGRVSSDSRFCSAIIIGEGATAESGVITVDFGTACTDPKGNVRTGKLILTYSNGPAGTVGFTVVMTTDNYTINGVKLEGSRTMERLASETSIKHEITLTDGKATWPDQSFATRSSSFVREVMNDGTIRLTGSAEGTNRRGREYTMNIDETLIYDIECAVSSGIYLPIEGVKTFTSGGRELTIDFGNGDCDGTVTVHVGDVSAPVNVTGS